MTEETLNLSIGQALDLGVQYALAGNHQSACTMFRGVLMHEPENFEAIERLGTSLFEMKQLHEAFFWFWRGKKLSRRNPMALTNYGLCLSDLGHPAEAIEDLERAVYHCEKLPMSHDAKSLIYNNLGNTYERLKRYDEALIALDKGLTFNPDDQFALYNRGIVLLRLNRHDEAIASLDRALAIKPNDPDATYNRGMGRLLLGDLEGGFADYEARLLTSENTVINLGLPAETKWCGDELNGKTILVHAEQGLGDVIQFWRFVPLMLERGASVLAIVHNDIKPLIADMPGLTVLTQGETLPAYDHWVALMSLPLVLGITREDQIPPPWVPAIDPEAVAKWGEGLSDTGMNVGVVWAGNWRHKNDEHRSIALKTFAKLFDAPVAFVSLQQLRPEDVEPFAQLREQHPNIAVPHVEDLADTAAVILNLDLVITVDTAVAHLAASLGVPTAILIPKRNTDWRWQLNRFDSPWYPRARLCRQSTVGDWGSVIAKLRGDLSATAEANKRTAA